MTAAGRAGFLIPAALLGALALASVGRAAPAAPPATPWLEDRRGGYLSEDLARGGDLGFWAVGSDESPALSAAILAVEDRRFNSHLGVDAVGIARALASTIGGRRQGGSTLAMQVVRLCDPEPRSLASKATEAVAAMVLTATHGRRAVLELYLATMPQGGRVRGAGYAARRYFGKPVADLSLAECAILAAIPNSPSSLNISEPGGFAAARERAGLVLRIMEERGAAAAEDCGLARLELARMPRPGRAVRPQGSLHFVARALAELGERYPGGPSGPAAASLDPEAQAAAAAAVAAAMADNARYGARNAAMIAADVRTGEVLAYVGSNGYFDGASAGSIDYAATPRSAGSALKPFLYALGLDEGGFTPASVLADLPFSVLSPSGEYRAGNFDDDYMGPMLYGRALANSRNTPALRVLESVGPDRFLALCRDLGLARADRDASWYGYGLAIGGLEVTLADLVAAYAGLASDGAKAELTFLVPSPGGPAHASPTARERPLSPEAARSVLRWLSDPQARAPSFPRLSALEYAWPVAVKTGTSQGYRDAWAVALSRSYVVGMWIGDPDAKPMNGVAGLAVAAYVRRMMEFLHPLQREGIDEELFPVPAGYEAFDLCVLSGALAGPDCPVTAREWISPDLAPRGACAVHRRLAVDAETGALADERTPAERISLRPYALLPPEYALWGAKKGLSAPAQATIAPPSVSILEPKDGSRFLFDPDLPGRFQTIQLQARSSAASIEVEWLVDGASFAKTAYPFAARLPLTPGEHSIVARSLAGGRPSAPVGIRVE